MERIYSLTPIQALKAKEMKFIHLFVHGDKDFLQDLNGENQNELKDLYKKVNRHLSEGRQKKQPSYVIIDSSEEEEKKEPSSQDEEFKRNN